MRKLLVLVIVLLLTAALLPIAPTLSVEAQRPDAPPYGVRGPYAAGTNTFEFETPHRTIRGQVWYPGVLPEGVEEYVEYENGLDGLVPPNMNVSTGRALADAEPLMGNAPYPLVIVSHGSGGLIYYTAYIAEHLASYGFVVMAPVHDGTSTVDSMRETPDVFYYAHLTQFVTHPQDITALIDYAATEMADLVNSEMVAVHGGSYGAPLAYTEGGGRMDFAAFRDWCEQGLYASGVTTNLCEILLEGDFEAIEQELIALSGLEVAPGEMWPTLGDPRVDAIIGMVPASIVYLGGGLEDVDLPTMLVMGGGDTGVIGELNGDLAYDLISSETKAKVVFEYANHGAFGYCDPPWVSVIFAACSDQVWDGQRLRDLNNHFTTAFLLTQLTGDVEATAALMADAVDFPGITYETTIE